MEIGFGSEQHHDGDVHASGGTAAFAPAAGTVTGPTTVTISTASPGASIRYTVDGSTPTAASPIYTAPVSVNTTLTLRAVASRVGWSDSTIRTGTYTMNLGALAAPVMTPAGYL